MPRLKRSRATHAAFRCGDRRDEAANSRNRNRRASAIRREYEPETECSCVAMLLHIWRYARDEPPVRAI